MTVHDPAHAFVIFILLIVLFLIILWRIIF